MAISLQFIMLIKSWNVRYLLVACCGNNEISPPECVSIDIKRLGSFGLSNSRHLCSNAVRLCQREPS